MSAKESTLSARIVLFGLEESLARELQNVLTRQEQAVYRVPYRSASDCLLTAEDLGADLVFCSANRESYQPLLRAVSRRRPDLPVIVVSRLPEVSEWLDAIEAGAADYCAAPFEPNHIQWILDSNLKHYAPAVERRAAG